MIIARSQAYNMPTHTFKKGLINAHRALTQCMVKHIEVV